MIKKKKTKRRFKRHIENRIKFGTGIKHLTLLFCDVWSFTSLSETYTTQEIMLILDKYLTEMEDVILRYGGTIDKFIGDEIMAEFGIPTHLPNHAEQACLAALEMVRKVRPFNQRRVRESKGTLEMQIGIHTGNMFAGYIGSKWRLDYTVIGHEVSRGLRLLGANKVYQTANHIIISEATKNELNDKIVTRELDNVRFKGLTKPDVIFDLVGKKDDLAYPEEFLTHYNEGLEYYKKWEWDKVIGEFKKALLLSEDIVSRLYIYRCKQFKTKPPPFDWNGVFTSFTK